VSARNLRRLHWCLFLLVFVAAELAAKTVSGRGIVRDLIPESLALVEGLTKAQETTSRFQHFMEREHPEVYQHPGLLPLDREFLSRYLQQVAPYLTRIRRLDQAFAGQVGPVLTDFQRAFPEFDSSRIKIFVILSLFQFDGKVPHDDARTLLLGLDSFAKFYGPDVPFRVILSHELFHLYHFQVNPLPRDLERLNLGRQVWQEGLATYASRTLCPSATLDDVLLDPRLANEGPTFLLESVRGIQSKLESTDDADTAFYLFHRAGGPRPSRMGYLVGYRIAQQLGAKMPLADLARLRGRKLMRLLREELKEMETNLTNQAVPVHSGS
jgi:hypothetical protein